MSCQFTGFFGYQILKRHGEIGNSFTRIANKMIMQSRYCVIMLNPVAEIPAGYASLLDKYCDVAVHVAEAEGGHFPFQGFVNKMRGRMIHTGSYEFINPFPLSAPATHGFHINNDS